MEKIYEVCYNCGDKHCCRGLCKELNDYLIKKKVEKPIKSLKMDNKV